MASLRERALSWGAVALGGDRVMVAELGFVYPEGSSLRQAHRPDSAPCQQAPTLSISPTPLVPCCPV